MNRRDFLITGAALSAAAMIPGSLLAESTKKENTDRFPQQLAPIMKGDVKEYRLLQLF